ncbi:MAG TPA: hypothetical protein PKO06_23505, partial [Candidatus Ozemobacteraceae bacterium]|nr:hypothetical protein [Candidatus Ozemobacteraceae bacterium]
GPQQADSPVFSFFTLPLTAAMPVLRLLRLALQQVTVTTQAETVRLRLPLRVLFAAFSSPLALISLLPIVPMLLAAASRTAKPVVAGVVETLRDGGCSAVRQAVNTACQGYLMDRGASVPVDACPDMLELLAAGCIRADQTCPQGGTFSIRRQHETFVVSCSVHAPERKSDDGAA